MTKQWTDDAIVPYLGEVVRTSSAVVILLPSSSPTLVSVLCFLTVLDELFVLYLFPLFLFVSADRRDLA